MEFYHLRSFVVVAKTGNLTAAAKQLFTTPPAISAHIKSLEEELKTPLFIRSNKGMNLTEKGKILLHQAQLTLDSAIDMVNLAAENQNEIIGTFKISVNQTAQKQKIPELIKYLNDVAPGLTIEISTLSTGNALSSLKHNEIDGAFIYGCTPNGVECLRLKEQEITTIAPTTSELTNKSLLPDLQTAPWVTMTSYCPFDLKLQDYFPNIKNTNVQSSDELTRLMLVKENCGLSFLEKDIAEEAAAQTHVKILPQLDFNIDLNFAFNQEHKTSPINTIVVNAIKYIWHIN